MQQFRQILALLDRDRANQDRLARLMLGRDVLDDGLELRHLRLVDDIGLVGAHHRHVGRDGDDAELVGLVELRGLCRRRTGHAGESAVEPEVVLQRDRGERLVLVLDPDAFLGLDRLVHALVVPTTGEYATGVLIDDKDLAVDDDVFLVQLVELLRLERVVQVTDERGVDGLVEVVDAELILDLLDATLAHAYGALLLVDVVVHIANQPRDDPGELLVPLGGHVSWSADDQRGPRFVDEDGVDLVDDGEVVAALDEFFVGPRHVVAQVVEAKFVVGAVRDVAGIRRPALLGRLVGEDHADREAEETVNPTHGLSANGDEVVVHGDDVNAVAVQRIEVRREDAGQGLALTGLHLGDVAQVQCGAAHDLHIEVPLTEDPPGRLPGDGERLNQEVVDGLPVGEPFPERVSLRAQFSVGEQLDLALKVVDRVGDRLEPAEDLALTDTEQLLQDHAFSTPSTTQCFMTGPKLGTPHSAS